MSRERGFALLIVLWAMSLLALLVAQFTAAGRTEVRVTANLRANAVTEAAADGAVHEAILRLLRRDWLPDARARTIRIGDTVVEVRILDESWKVNPNTASLPMLQALLANSGVNGERAASIARAITDHRTVSGRSRASAVNAARPLADRRPVSSTGLFESLDDMATVPEITPALLSRLRPFMSVYQEADALESNDALPVKLTDAPRLVGDGWHFGSSGRIMLAIVEVTASGVKGGRFRRQAIVRLRAEASLDQAPYQILTWETPTD